MLRHCFLVLGFCSLAACSNVPLNSLDSRLKGLDKASEIANIPFYPQVEDQCGPSSLATILDFQGITISPEALRGKLYIPGKEGTVTTEIIARARRFGLLVYQLEPELINILLEIKAGNPILIMQNLGFNWLPAWHFSVAFGYDLDEQTISLRSGDDVKQTLDFSLFQKTWSRADSWAIAIVPPNKLPQTASPQGVIHSASQLEQVGEVKAARQAYQAVLAKWPNEILANFGAGNAAYALGEYKDAEGFFMNYLKAQPKAAQVWNNLAYTLVEQGCIASANKAISCALDIDPNNKNLIDSAREINQYSIEKTNANCLEVVCQTAQ